MEGGDALPYPYASDRDEILSRLKKVEGQIRGVHRMVAEDAYCIDVLTQITAIISGMEKVGTRVLREHIQGCVRDALESGNEGRSDDRIEELVRVVERFVRA